MATAEATVRIGPAGWSYEDWKGIVYPADMPRSLHPLTFLAQFFDSVEVNSSFYHPPAASLCASWIGKVEANPAFMFTAKLWRGFTHERNEWPGDTAVQRVMDGLEPLARAGKLGALLVQFPWSFKRTPDARKWLARVLDTFACYPLAVELRHASWNHPKVFESFTEHKVAFCNIDQPLFSDSIEPAEHVTAPLAYVRLHGRNKADWFREDAGRDDRYNYLYSPEELSGWIERIARIRKMAESIYVITNNHYEGQAVVNAFELQARLTDKSCKPPEPLVARYPRLQQTTAGVR